MQSFATQSLSLWAQLFFQVPFLLTFDIFDKHEKKSPKLAQVEQDHHEVVHLLANMQQQPQQQQTFYYCCMPPLTTEQIMNHPYFRANKMANALEKLKAVTTVVADTGDISEIKK